MESIGQIIERVGKEMREAEAAFNPDNLKVGDRIEFYHRPYGHCAFGVVTKINSKTFKMLELPTSYRPGTDWTVHKTTPGLRFSTR